MIGTLLLKFKSVIVKCILRSNIFDGIQKISAFLFLLLLNLILPQNIFGMEENEKIQIFGASMQEIWESSFIVCLLVSITLEFFFLFKCAFVLEISFFQRTFLSAVKM